MSAMIGLAFAAGIIAGACAAGVGFLISQWMDARRRRDSADELPWLVSMPVDDDKAAP